MKIVFRFYHSILDNKGAIQYKYGSGDKVYSQVVREINKMALAVAKSLYSILHTAPYSTEPASLNGLVSTLFTFK